MIRTPWPLGSGQDPPKTYFPPNLFLGQGGRFIPFWKLEDKAEKTGLDSGDGRQGLGERVTKILELIFFKNRANIG